METPLILVIDDERLMVKSTCMTLSYSGFDAIGAPDGPQGVAMARSRRPAVILLDIMMPGVDGWQVLDQLKKDPATKDIPVIIFTAREYPNGKSLSLQHGAADFLAKPYEFDDLLKILKHQIASVSD